MTLTEISFCSYRKDNNIIDRKDLKIDIKRDKDVAKDLGYGNQRKNNLMKSQCLIVISS